MRDQIQERAKNILLENGFHGIILSLAPRTGKTKPCLEAFKTSAITSKILITAPFNSILESWKSEILKWGASHLDIKLINQRSLEKEDLKSYDIICCDEVHTLSQNQINQLRFLPKAIKLFGVTGSLSLETAIVLKTELKLTSVLNYTIENAINDNIISDYRINIYECYLDDVERNVLSGTKYKTFYTTELKHYLYLTQQFNKFKELQQDRIKMFYAGQRARFIYSCKTKLNLAKKLIDKQSRVLVFTNLVKVANLLTKDSFTSKEKTDIKLEKFIKGDIDKLTVINMASMGITVPNLKHIVCHQLQSSEELAIQKLLRAMNFELGEMAEIDIVVIKNTEDEKWLNKALLSFNRDKIAYRSL
jgi:hypothetical protein